MIEFTVPYRIKVLSGGERALALLRTGSPCRVAAVFTRSFYLQTEGAMACLGGQEIGSGPLNALLEVPRGMNWLASGLREGARCRRAADTLYLSERFILSSGSAILWAPAPAPSSLDPVAVAQALRHLELACADLAPSDGLARLAFFGRAAANRSFVEALGCDPIAASRHWLNAIFGGVDVDQGWDNLAWVEALAGLGPGLTPSGDDYLGGFMIALHALGWAESARQLAEAIVSAAAESGNAISAAHLAAAGEAQGHAAIHDLLHSLLRGDCTNINPKLTTISRIGHCSGWDILAGMVMVLRSWRFHQDRRQVA
jgi:hypothetical protein